MTHQLSRREQKAMAKLGQKPKKPMLTVDTKSIKDGIVFVIANVVAVFVFLPWLALQNFRAWRKERRA